jgi:predicted nuclease with TOPRIM domain
VFLDVRFSALLVLYHVKDDARLAEARAMEETLQTIGERLIKLDEKLDKKLDAFGQRFDEKLDAGFTAVAVHFGKIDERFTRINERFTKIDERFTKIDEHLTRIDGRLLQFDGRFKQHDDRFGRIEKRFDDLEHRVATGFEDVKGGLTPVARACGRSGPALTNSEHDVE